MELHSGAGIAEGLDGLVVEGLPLIKTKICPPQNLHPLLPRQRLSDLLLDHDQGLSKLLLLSAPAGFGKTTLLCQYRQELIESEQKVAWLSLDEADNDPIRFMYYLVASIRMQWPKFGDRIINLLKSDLGVSVDALLEAAAIELEAMEESVYIMIDDFHLLVNSAVLGVGLRIVDQIAANSRFIVASRNIPREALIAGFQKKGEFFQLDREAMRFNFDETCAFLKDVKQLDLSEPQMKALHEKTEGWVTALQLASISLHDEKEPSEFIDSFSGTHRDIADYLAEDVLARQSKDVRDFLLKTSILDRLNADLCDWLTGRDDSQHILQKLEMEEMFLLPLDANNEWYRYHQLFSDFLSTTLRREVGDVSSLHTMVGKWYGDKGYPDKAIQHALAANDYDLAAKVLEQQSSHLIANSNLYSILSMLDALPAQVVNDQAIFALFYAWKLGFDQKFAEAEAEVDLVFSKLFQGQLQSTNLSVPELLMAAYNLKAMVCLYRDKLKVCLHVTEQWLPRLPSKDPVLKTGMAVVQATAQMLEGRLEDASNSVAIAYSSLAFVGSPALSAVVGCIEVSILRQKGELRQARALAEKKHGEISEMFGTKSRVGSMLMLVYADTLYELGEWDGLRERLSDALATLDLTCPLDLIARGTITLAKLEYFSGDTELAYRKLDQLMSLARRNEYTRILSMVLGVKAQLLLLEKRRPEAIRVTEYLGIGVDKGTNVSGQYSGFREETGLLRARLLMALDLPGQAIEILEKMLSWYDDSSVIQSAVRCKTLLVVAFNKAGRVSDAMSVLMNLLGEVQGAGYLRMFVDEGEVFVEAIRSMQEVREFEIIFTYRQREFLSALIPLSSDVLSEHRDAKVAVAGDAEDVREVVGADVKGVTKREAEILQLVASGHSNKQIAGSVHLSEATIKWHLHNIFRKLEVKTRTQAIVVAREIGLVAVE